MNQISRNRPRGFTLVELLVVISIIALLSSIILSALSNARQKGKSSAVQQEMIQLRDFFEINRDANGSYATAFGYITGLAPTFSGGGVGYYVFNNSGAGSCTANISNAQLQNICTSILADDSAASYPLYIGGPGTSSGDPTWMSHAKYSIMAQFPNTQKYACLGSGNNTSQGNSSSDYAHTGCLANP